MSDQTEHLLKNLETELIAWGRSRSSLIQYPKVIKKYLAFTNSEDIFTREAINDYLANLTKEGKGGNTKRFQFYILKKFFQVNGQGWPFTRGAPEKPSAHELYAPAMPSSDIERMIKNRGRLEDWQKGILALSTTYGLRQEEILRVRSADIQDGRIFIHTAKKGVERWHILPPEISPCVAAWASLDDRYRPAKSTLSLEFHRIVRLCGITTDTTGMGYHCIRRELATRLLQSGVNPVYIYQFMRWSLPSVLGILGSYAKLPDELVDRHILAQDVHPFLKFWREE